MPRFRFLPLPRNEKENYSKMKKIIERDKEKCGGFWRKGRNI
jgi:hypothetical protein